MFREEREYNIISGQSVKYTSQRSQSCADQRVLFTQRSSQPLKGDRLGKPRDQKDFRYAYDDPPRALTQQDSKPALSTIDSALGNYVSTSYNIVTLQQQLPTSKIAEGGHLRAQLPMVNRRSPFTGILHAGRLMAPNYHPDYAQRQANHEFSHKKGLCSSLCDAEKSYAIGKYFRKLK